MAPVGRRSDSNTVQEDILAIPMALLKLPQLELPSVYCRNADLARVQSIPTRGP